MNTFSYRDMTLSYYQDGSNYDGSQFHIMNTCFLDYNNEIRSITIKHQLLGHKNVWLAEFSGNTTEYTGSLGEVLKKVYDYYQTNSIHSHEKAQDDQV